MLYIGVAYGLRDSLEVAKSLGVAPKSTTICRGGAKYKQFYPALKGKY